MKSETTQYRIPITLIILAVFMLIGMWTSAALAAHDDDLDDDGPVVGTATISESRAITIADRTYSGDGNLTQIELENENGVLVYAVEYSESDGNEVDIKVNARTGNIVTIESDENESINDDENDTDDEINRNRTENMERLITLLNQLISLLRQQQSALHS